MAYSVADFTHNAAYAHQGCRSLYGGTRAAQCWKHSPPTNVRLNPTFSAPSDSTFESRSRRHTWFIFLCYCLCVDRFFSGLHRLSPLLKKQTKHQNVIRNVVDKHHFEDVLPLKRYLLIYLFNLFFFRASSHFSFDSFKWEKINSFCFCLDFTQSSTSVESKNLTIPVFASLLVYFWLFRV